MEHVYDVLKFISDGRHTHISMECVKGTLLGRWVQEPSAVCAQQIWTGAKALSRSLSAYHSSKIAGGYGILSPYTVAAGTKRDGEWYLLDPKAAANARLVSLGSSRAVAESFLPRDVKTAGQRSEQTDLYSFGRLVQYTLSKTEPDMDRRQRRAFQKITAACLKQEQTGKLTFVKLTELFREWE